MEDSHLLSFASLSWRTLLRVKGGRSRTPAAPTAFVPLYPQVQTNRSVRAADKSSRGIDAPDRLLRRTAGLRPTTFAVRLGCARSRVPHSLGLERNGRVGPFGGAPGASVQVLRPKMLWGERR